MEKNEDVQLFKKDAIDYVELARLRLVAVEQKVRVVRVSTPRPPPFDITARRMAPRASGKSSPDAKMDEAVSPNKEPE